MTHTDDDPRALFAGAVASAATVIDATPASQLDSAEHRRAWTCATCSSTS